MLKDVIPFDNGWSKLHKSSRSAKAISAFVHFIERKLGAEFVYDETRLGIAFSDTNSPPTFITRIHSYIQSTRIARQGSLVKPEWAPRGTHKEYPSLPRIKLPKAEAMPDAA